MLKMHTWCFLIFYFSVTSATKIEKVKPEKLVGGYQFTNNPYWDNLTQSVYFHASNKLVRYDYNTKAITFAEFLNAKIGAFTLAVYPPGNFVVIDRKDILLVAWDSTGDKINPDFYKYASFINCDKDDVISHGQCDAKGRFWMTSIKDTKCEYIEAKRKHPAFDLKESFKLVEEIFGIVWSSNNNIMYYIDTISKVIHERDYNLEIGDYNTTRKPVFNLTEYNLSVPTGITIDTDGNLWLALPQESKIIVVNPGNSTLLRTIDLIDANATGLTFGGPNMNTLFLTSTATPGSLQGSGLYQISNMNAKGFLPHPFGHL